MSPVHAIALAAVALLVAGAWFLMAQHRRGQGRLRSEGWSRVGEPLFFRIHRPKAAMDGKPPEEKSVPPGKKIETP